MKSTSVDPRTPRGGETARTANRALNRTHDVDVLVVGAGPAGAAAADAAARGGLNTLVVDRAGFPRAKPCGGCLNAPALALLREHMAERLRWPAFSPTHTLRLSARGNTQTVQLAPGRAVDRASFDAALMMTAINAGAVFESGVSARHPRRCDSGWLVDLHEEGSIRTVRTSLLIVADGLGGTFLSSLPGFEVSIAPRGRIGIAATFDARIEPEPGVIAMAVARRGYVGRVHLPDGSMHLGAAVDPEFLRSAGDPAACIAALLREADQTLDEGVLSSLRTVRFKGTPVLTRTRKRVEAPGLLVAGDSAGYGEPFTGEGIAWSLAMGFRAGAFAEPLLRGNVAPGTWTQFMSAEIATRRRRCRIFSAVAHRPRLVAAIQVVPPLAAWLGNSLSKRLAAPFPAHNQSGLTVASGIAGSHA